MIANPDIFRAAKLLIDQRGEDTTLRAAKPVDELLEAGDMRSGPRPGGGSSEPLRS